MKLTKKNTLLMSVIILFIYSMYKVASVEFPIFNYYFIILLTLISLAVFVECWIAGYRLFSKTSKGTLYDQLMLLVILVPYIMRGLSIILPISEYYIIISLIISVPFVVTMLTKVKESMLLEATISQ